MLFPTLGPSSLPVVVDQPDERHVASEQLLCWSGMTDTEHSTPSSSNEEDQLKSCLQVKGKFQAFGGLGFQKPETDF